MVSPVPRRKTPDLGPYLGMQELPEFGGVAPLSPQTDYSGSWMARGQRPNREGGERQHKLRSNRCRGGRRLLPDAPPRAVAAGRLLDSRVRVRGEPAAHGARGATGARRP